MLIFLWIWLSLQTEEATSDWRRKGHHEDQIKNMLQMEK